MSKLSKEKRDKLILVCLLFIGALGVLYTFVLGAQRDKLSTYENQLASVRDKLSKAERLMKSGPIVESNLAENSKKLELMQKDMAPQGAYYWFLKLLEEFRTREGLDQNFLADLRQPEATDPGLLPKFPYRALTTGVRTSGKFHDIGRFIADFENAFPYMRVEQIRLQPQTEGQGRRARGEGPNQQGEADQDMPAPSTEKLVGDLLIVTFVKPSAS